MMTRKSIDTVLLSVAADKLSQREWDWIKLMKPMGPASANGRQRHTRAPQRYCRAHPPAGSRELICPVVSGFSPRPLKKLFTAN